MWDAAAGMGYSWGPCYCLILLTGDRRGEWARARRDWLAADLTRAVAAAPRSRAAWLPALGAAAPGERPVRSGLDESPRTHPGRGRAAPAANAPRGRSGVLSLAHPDGSP